MLLILLLVINGLGGLSAVQWIPPTQMINTTQFCFGASLTLGWDYTVAHSEKIEDIKWLFTPNTATTPTIIASYVYGFFNPIPSYSSRLTHPANGTVVLSGLSAADAGTYMVEIISTHAAGSFSTARRSLVVTMTDPATYRHKTLAVKTEQQAVADASGELHMELTCGPLAWRGEPPVDVIWKTPSGVELPSSYFQNDTFNLLLTNPLQGGSYTCRLASTALAALCLRSDDLLLREVTLRVDSVDARLALLDQREQAHSRHVEAELEKVKGDNRDLKQQLEQYHNKLSRHVEFHTWLGSYAELNIGEDIKFAYVHTNTGGAYDVSTGIFTAPYDGSYFFAVSVLNGGAGYQTHCNLFVDGTTVTWGVAVSQNEGEGNLQGTGVAVVHLVKGNKVWVQNFHDNSKYTAYSTFSGFLIHPDP